MESKQLNDFTKGLISRISADKIADNAFSDCMNIDLSENFLPKSVKGKIKVNDTAIDNASCMGMTVYNNKENGAYIVVACGGYLWYRLVTGGTFAKYQIDNNGVLEDVRIDPNVRVRFAQYNDRLFVFTGKYPVIENLSFNDSCILVIFKTNVSYINRDSFYAWNNNGNVYYTLSATPASGDAIFSDLYRTKIDATVSAYSDNTFTDSSGGTYTRTSSSDKIDPNVPKGIKYPIIHQERLFGFGSIEDDNGIYWSQPYEPTTWTPVYGLNYDTVGKDDGEKITGAVSFGGVYIYVFKQHNVYRYLTSGDIDSWQSNKVDTIYGCVAHETIKLFQGVLTYLSPDGVAQLNGNSAVLVDEAIRDKTNNVSVGSDIMVNRSYTQDKFYDKKNILGSYNSVFGNLFSTTPEHLPTDTYIKTDNNNLVQQQTEMPVYSRGQGIDYYFKYTPKTTKNITSLKFAKLITQNYQTAQFRLIICDSAPTTADVGHAYASSQLTSNPLEFTFSSSVSLVANTTYYIYIESNSFSSSAIVLSYLSRYYSNAGYKHTYVSYSTYTVEDTNIMPIMVDDNMTELENLDSDNLSSYISTQFEVNANNHDLDFDIYLYAKANIIDSVCVDSKVVVYVGFYSVAGTTWNNISSSDILTFTLDTSNYEQYSNTWNFKRTVANCKQYMKYKIVFKRGLSSFYQINIKSKQNLAESDAIEISGSNPSGWGIAEIVRTGSDDVANIATIYMRSGTAQTISSATYYEISNNQQISASIPLARVVQFKIVFPSGSDNEVSSIKINYFTKESITKVCAIVWKNKYRLNMPKDDSTDNNAVEYILDKDGYWTIKDSENNFEYAFSVNDLFACSGRDGFVYKKEVGYTNAGQSYNSYFVTKKFVMSDFENLFRNFKLRFVSNVNITVGVSVDDGEYVNYTISNSGQLVEILKSLVGIVRGQTIKFKFSWTANESTQIHNFVFYWNVLRQLNV